jgi:N,N'-diacetyllegionaminate synthase
MSVYIIAEIGQAHDGSLGILHSYVDSLSTTGVDAIKFQTHIAEAESSKYETFRVNFSYTDKTRYDYWKRMEFSLSQWNEIKSHCDQVGLDFISSPFSNKAVDMLEKVGVNTYKVGSGEISNLLLLEKIAKTKKKIILSSGLSTYYDIDRAVELLKPFASSVAVLQCTTEYPTQAKNIGLNVISRMKERYALPIGISDHSGTIFPSLAATSLGANILEFHAVFDKRIFGPDSTSSLDIDEIKELVNGVRFIEESLNNPINKNDNEEQKRLRRIFGKSLSVNKNLIKGSTITFDDLEAKKPEGYGIHASFYKSVIGRTTNKSLSQWDFINEEDLI